MRLTDIVFRQGHLSERALVDAVTSGARPMHLDRCDICAARAVELARWMDEIQSDAADSSDAVFTPERLAAQQHQILRRLEQLDHPARVISFPAASRHDAPANGRRVSVSWVGIAAAAGLVIGLVGGQVSARMSRPAAPPPAASTAMADAATAALPETVSAPGNPQVFSESLESLDIRSLDALNDLTPRIMQVAQRTGR